MGDRNGGQADNREEWKASGGTEVSRAAHGTAGKCLDEEDEQASFWGSAG